MRNIIFILIMVLSMSAVAVAVEEEGQISVSEIDEDWEMFGEGNKSLESGILLLRQSRKSEGVVLLNPEVFEKKVVLRFEIMPLTPFSLFSIFFSVSNLEESDSLNIPYRYNGGMKFWNKEVQGYLFRLCNAAANEVPYLWKLGENIMLAEGEENVVIPGIFNKVEVGRKRDKFWLLINGKEILRVGDFHDYTEGQIGFRLSGVFGRKGECLIRKVSINER